MLAHKQFDAFIGQTDLVTHRVDATVDIVEFAPHDGHEVVRLVMQPCAAGDVGERSVELRTPVGGEHDLERVVEPPPLVALVVGAFVFLVVVGEHVVAAHRPVVHLPAQRVAVVAFGDHKFAQIHRYAAQGVVDDVDDVGDLFGGRALLHAIALQLGDLRAALLDFPLKQFDALMHVDGELLARVLNLHDD